MAHLVDVLDAYTKERVRQESTARKPSEHKESINLQERSLPAHSRQRQMDEECPIKREEQPKANVTEAPVPASAASQPAARQQRTTQHARIPRRDHAVPVAVEERDVRLERHVPLRRVLLRCARLRQHGASS